MYLSIRAFISETSHREFPPEYLNADGTTIMLVTHDSKVAAKCKRVLYIVDGNIKEEFVMSQDEALSQTDKERRLNTWLMDLGW